VRLVRKPRGSTLYAGRIRRLDGCRTGARFLGYASYPGAYFVLSTTIACLLLLWISALFFSITLGGWIHLLPVAAAPLLVARLCKADPPPTADQTRWMNERLRRERRRRPGGD
jgi:hypothetical protein